MTITLHYTYIHPKHTHSHTCHAKPQSNKQNHMVLYCLYWWLSLARIRRTDIWKLFDINTYVCHEYTSINLPHLFYIHPGCLVHTQCPHGKKPLCFMDLFEYPHDANLTLNILLWTLERNSPLPPVLHLQFDNCFRENKNRYIFGMCALLIELKLVKKVRNYINLQ